MTTERPEMPQPTESGLVLQFAQYAKELEQRIATLVTIIEMLEGQVAE